MSLTNRWSVLGLLCFARLSMGLHFQSVAAVAPFLMTDLSLTYAQLGTLVGLYKVPGILLSLPGGLAARRLGDRPVILVGLGLLGGGAVFIALGASFGTAILGRILVGCGGALLATQLAKAVTDWFVGHEISTALGLLMSMWPLGLTAAFIGLGYLAVRTSWRAALLVTAGQSAVALLAVAVLYRNRDDSGPVAPAGAGALWTLSRHELVLTSFAGLGWMFLNVGSVLCMTFGPMLLIRRGWSVTLTMLVVGWASLLSIAAMPVGGYLIDSLKRRDLFIVAGSSLSALTLLLFGLGDPSLLWIMLFGLAAGAPISGVVALPSEVLRPENRAVGFGVWQTIYHVGMAAIPPLGGYLVDVTGTPAAPIFLGAVCWILVIPSLSLFRLAGRLAPNARADSPRLYT